MSLIINNHHHFHKYCLDGFKIQQKKKTQHNTVTPIRSGLCDVYLSGALQHSEGKTNSTEGNTENTIK